MKCLSICQPFADLIVKGKKTIELRSWNTNFRGEFLIHAPLKLRIDDCNRLGINKKSLRTGVIIGKAEIYDVKKYSSQLELMADKNFHLASKNFFGKRYGFLIKNAKELRISIPCKGKLGFFDVGLKPTKIGKNEIKQELFDEEFRYQWINHH